MTTTIDQKLLDATIAVLAESGWDGVSLERVAERAGRSRVTLWRQGVTRDALLDALLGAVAGDYRDTMWPVLTAPGSGRDRLVRTIGALCEVIDRHLPLMLASDTVFHQKPRTGQGVVFLEPFERVLRDGLADGSLHPRGRIDDSADIVMNAVAWTYVHMRGRHRWSRDRARRMILDLVLHGVADA